ncbi:MAG: hypothetical protein LBF72_00940 [Holosporales bacterium]|nr:hypothetical protein [Holosporales bacterium]
MKKLFFMLGLCASCVNVATATRIVTAELDLDTMSSVNWKNALLECLCEACQSQVQVTVSDFDGINLNRQEKEALAQDLFEIPHGDGVLQILKNNSGTPLFDLYNGDNKDNTVFRVFLGALYLRLCSMKEEEANALRARIFNLFRVLGYGDCRDFFRRAWTVAAGHSFPECVAHFCASCSSAIEGNKGKRYEEILASSHIVVSRCTRYVGWRAYLIDGRQLKLPPEPEAAVSCNVF